MGSVPAGLDDLDLDRLRAGGADPEDLLRAPVGIGVALEGEGRDVDPVEPAA